MGRKGHTRDPCPKDAESEGPRKAPGEREVRESKGEDERGRGKGGETWDDVLQWATWLEKWEGIDLDETKQILGWVTEEDQGERNKRPTEYATWVNELPWLNVGYAEEIFEGDETDEDGVYDPEEWEEVMEGEMEGKVDGREREGVSERGRGTGG